MFKSFLHGRRRNLRGGNLDGVNETPEEIFENPKREKTRRFIRHLKVLEFTIDNKTFDYPGMISSIEGYCYKNMISRKLCNEIQLVLEELIQQILIPELEAPKINCVVEYSEENAEINMTINYNGKCFNPSDSENKLSYAIVKGAAKEIYYEPNNNDEIYTNKIKIFIR